MLKLKHFVACESVIRGAGNRPSYINIFDQIYANSVPATHASWTIAVSTKGDPGRTYVEKVEIVRVDTGEVIGQTTTDIEISELGGNTLVINLTNTLFPEYGRYWIKVTVENQDQALTDPELHQIVVTTPPSTEN